MHIVVNSEHLQSTMALGGKVGRPGHPGTLPQLPVQSERRVQQHHPRRQFRSGWIAAFTGFTKKVHRFMRNDKDGSPFSLTACGP